MARPKRMGASPALDEWFPPAGQPARPALTSVAVPEPPRAPRARPRPVAGAVALDELLPGPAPDDQPAGPGAPWPALRPVPGDRPTRRPRGANALDELLPGPAPPRPRPGPKVRTGFSLSPDVLEAARDAVAYLAGTPDAITLSALAEHALTVEIERLTGEHRGGEPFPKRPDNRSGDARPRR